MLPVLLAAAFLAGAVMVVAVPNFSATTGVIGVPNAHVVPSGQLVGAVDAVFFNDTILNGRLVYSLTPRFEGGIGVVVGDEDGVIVNGKYQFTAPVAGFTTALSATYSTANNAGNGWQVYLVGTRPMLRTAAAGGNQLYGTPRVSFTDLEDASAVRPFAAAQWLLNGRTEIGAQFMLESGDFAKSISLLYLRQTFSPALTGQIGITSANGFIGDSDHDLFAGFACIFGR